RGRADFTIGLQHQSTYDGRHNTVVPCVTGQRAWSATLPTPPAMPGLDGCERRNSFGFRVGQRRLADGVTDVSGDRFRDLDVLTDRAVRASAFSAVSVENERK